MAGFIKVEVEMPEQQALNMKINEEIFHTFQIKCKQRKIPMNVLLEAFMDQYASGQYHIDDTLILKWKHETENSKTLNSTFNKEIYTKFKNKVKENGFFVNDVVAAFIDEYANYNLKMGFTKERHAATKRTFWRCPLCNRQFESITENWCAKQFEEAGDYCIICRECGNE